MCAQGLKRESPVQIRRCPATVRPRAKPEHLPLLRSSISEEKVQIARRHILPKQLDPAKDPIDVFAIDQAYWKSFWHRPGA